jgi:hypothetical protein
LDLTKTGGIPVTVCVAAISVNMIFGASDRMITAGDIEFEPEHSKIWQLTTSIAAMVAGDIGVQSEISQPVLAIIRERIEASPKEWIKISEVAHLWAQFYSQVKARRAEQLILRPLGLTSETYITRNRDLSPELASKIAQELMNFDMPSVQTIITGVDSEGAHIYVVTGDHIQCQDKIGFAAIGVGAWHAESQFMFNGHTPNRLLPETMLLTYSAKKRAEVAPGVGENTDMFMVGPTLGSYISFYPETLEKLDRIYVSARADHLKADQQAFKAVNEYVMDTINEANKKSELEGQSNAAIPVDTTSVAAEGAAAGTSITTVKTE